MRNFAALNTVEHAILDSPFTYAAAELKLGECARAWVVMRREQSLMEMLTEEWEKCLYTDQKVSSKLPPSVRNPNPDVSLEPVPYFEMLWATEAVRAHTSENSFQDLALCSKSDVRQRPSTVVHSTDAHRVLVPACAAHTGRAPWCVQVHVRGGHNVLIGELVCIT